jgi:hypothetical protein
LDSFFDTVTNSQFFSRVPDFKPGLFKPGTEFICDWNLILDSVRDKGIVLVFILPYHIFLRQKTHMGAAAQQKFPKW